MIEKNVKHHARQEIRSAMARLVMAAREKQPHVDPPEPERAAEPADQASSAPVARARKVPVSIRLDADLVAALRGSGPGWQSRVNAMLRDALDLDEATADHPAPQSLRKAG